MNSRIRWLQALLPVFAIVFAAGTAHALTIKNLKGQRLQDLYGTYAPGGDCHREPRVTVDDSGFAYAWRGKTVQSGTIVLALTFMGQDYQGISRYFFPFPLSENDYGHMGMTFNPDERAGTLTFESNLAKGQSLTPLQAALVRGSPYAKCGTHAEPAPSNAAGTAATPVKIDFGKDAITPTPAQNAAIRRAAADDLKDPLHPGEPLYAVALADLDGDGRSDLLIQYTYASGFCGSTGCSGIILMATPGGYAGKGIELPNFGTLAVLPAMDHGMHDLQFDGDSPIWKWNGKEYDVAKTDLPGSKAPAWVTRQAAGHPMMAVATPIDSTIKNLLVFCEQGTPLLAMVTKAPRSAGPVTLTFVFRGWTVNLPMQHNSQSATLWVADLSRSELPQWLAHRGNTATTRELAHLADMAFLRINGVMEGEISLKNSTAATQTALTDCYRY